jgi:exopolysaccharide biosynthesis polyprenyl glycosylphosphotransferase
MKQMSNIKTTKMITMLLDLVSMIAAFCLAGYIRWGGQVHLVLGRGLYSNILIVLILSNIIISNSSNNENVCKRGFYQECFSLMKDQTKIALVFLGYMFAFQKGLEFSRIFFGLFILFNFLITYVVRSYMKMILLIGYKKSASSNKVMLVTFSENASHIIRKIRKQYEWQIVVDSIAVWDEDIIGQIIEGVEVIANRTNLLDMVKHNVVDEVFIHLPNMYNIEIEELILELEKMGIIVHLDFNVFNNLNVKNKMVEEYAGHQVITFATNYFDDWNIFVKRTFDIIGASFGLFLTALIAIFVAPAIYFESRGPIFFSQVRIGKNGRRFKIYKFRSMYEDAEQKKADLMEQNEMKGLMFKITDDPRITKVGKFIRKSSLDEFPQFINVLKGDMSLVGTRPPTEDEFELYESRHKRRLSLKPGLTGMWQVSGRSDIEDFEEVVKMDLEYIDNWSMLLDIKIVLKTIRVVLLGRGSK